MNTQTNKCVYTNSMYPSSREARYKMKCHLCDKPILIGQYITRTCEPTYFGVRLRPRKTSDGSTYIIETGKRWVHIGCDAGCWTEYSAELEAAELDAAGHKKEIDTHNKDTKRSSLFGTFGDHIINNYNDYYYKYF